MKGNEFLLRSAMSDLQIELTDLCEAFQSSSAISAVEGTRVALKLFNVHSAKYMFESAKASCLDPFSKQCSSF